MNFKKLIQPDRPMRLAFSQLFSLIEALGWKSERCDDNEFPYSTMYWIVIPKKENHINSDEMKKFLYACGYYDVQIDHKNKFIRVDL